MGKFKQLLENQKNSIKDIFLNRYPLTLCVAIICCIFFVILDICEYDSRHDGLWGEYILNFLLIYSLGTLFAETVWKGNRDTEKEQQKKVYGINVRIISYVLLAAISFIWVVLGYNREIFSGKGEELFGRASIFYVILFAGLSLYWMIKNSGLTLHKYLVSMVFGLIKVFAVILALNIGLILLLELFDTLIIDIKEWRFLQNFEVLLTGFVYLPYALICMTDVKEEKSRFVRAFVLYLLMPLVLAGVAIIYLYMIRILFDAEIPSNEIFPICAWLFAIGVPVWTMAYAFVSDSRQGIYAKIVKYMKFIYAPFLLLEGYALGVRLFAHGLTGPRYAAVIFMLFQIIYILWEPVLLLWRRRKKQTGTVYGQKYENMIPVFLGIGFLALFAPVINYQYLSYLSQKGRFEEIYADINSKQIQNNGQTEFAISEKKAQEARSIYNYLKWDYDGDIYLVQTYGKEEMEDWISLVTQNLSQDYGEYWDYISMNCVMDGLDVSGYSRAYQFSYYDYYNYDDDARMRIDDYAAAVISYGQNEKTITVDLTEVLQQLCDGRYEGYTFIREKPTVIDVDNEIRLVIYSIDFQCYRSMGYIKDVDIFGYVLEK